MNIELDFLYDDFLRDVDSTSPLLSSEGTTDIFLEDMNAGEEPVHHFPADFNPDDFLNDIHSDDSLAAESNSSYGAQKFDLPGINFNTVQSWDSSQTSPQSSIESASTAVHSSPELVNTPAVVATRQANLSLALRVEECNVNQQRSFTKEEHFPLVNLCAVTSSGHTKIVLPKFVANNNKFASIKTTNKLLLDEKVLRKQQRMIRNRESASLSRKKKKDYVNSLESKISDLEKENIQLKCEVSGLKTELTKLLQTCTCNSRQFLSNHKSIGSHVKKNTAVLLAMVFMVSLNFGKFHSFLAPEVSFQRHKLVSLNLNSNSTSMRKLLWVNDSAQMEEEVYGPQENCNETLIRNYINQTENLRLTSELRKLARTQKNLKSAPQNSDYDPVQYYALKSTKYLNNMLKNQEFIPERNKYSKLFQKIHRKNDTFYILSFNSENILLPAALYNESSRPKMSLMLPTKSFMGNRKIAFMQIDCEVLNTSTIQFRDSYVPTNIRNQLKNNPSDESKSNVTDNKDKHKFNSYGLPWKDFNKKNIYKAQLYEKNAHQSNKNSGGPDLPSIYSLF